LSDVFRPQNPTWAPLGAIIAVIAATVLSALCPATATEVVVGPARVIDCDTADVGGVRVRLEGIDAPEKNQTCVNARGREWDCGRVASRRLQQLMTGAEVRCEGEEKDDYGRLLGTCSVGVQNINARMIRDGLAWAFVKYSSIYAGIEKEARQARRGVFEVVNLPPWEFRAEQWKKSQPSDPAEGLRSCRIKGNVSGSGERIYHAPGQRHYERVKVDAKQGERWFCNETEAERAGWRKAVR
jgi:endonuclease YncB( thermonuclease family)